LDAAKGPNKKLLGTDQPSSASLRLGGSAAVDLETIRTILGKLSRPLLYSVA